MAKYAFVSGVSNYNRTGWKDLWGVENDLESWLSVLSEELKVPPNNTRLLVDSRCTTEAIMHRLKWLVSNCKKDDTGIFIYCGHGTQVGLRNQDGKVDSVNESLVPYDFDWDTPLTDNLIAKVVKDTKAEDSKLFFIFDCCHSGGLARDIVPDNIPEYPRELQAPRDISYRIEVAKHENIATNTINHSLENIASCMFACQKDEKAWETWVNGKFRGVFSYSMEVAIKKGLSKVEDLINSSTATIKDKGFVGNKSQNPLGTNTQESLK